MAFVGSLRRCTRRYSSQRDEFHHAEKSRSTKACKESFRLATNYRHAVLRLCGEIVAMNYLHHTSFGIGVLGVLVIVFGVIGGLTRFIRSEWHAVQGANVDEDRRSLRHLLGYYLLLGLEFLIAADIIDTLMKPTPQDLLVLGAIIVIRTVISYSLNTELKSEQQHKVTAL
jgi:uncharacterized membrane protein